MKSLQVNGNSYIISLDDEIAFSSKIAVSVCADKVSVATDLALSECGTVITGKTDAGDIKVSFVKGEDGASVTITAEVEVASSFRKLDIYPVYDVTLTDATHLLSHGRTMGGCKTCALPAAVLDTEPGEESGAVFKSYFQTMISFGEKKLHVSQPIRQKHISYATGWVDGSSIKGFSVLTTVEFAEAGVYQSTPLTLASVTDGFKAMEDYGDGQVEVKPPSEPQPVGWNSWDYYRWTISEEETLKNAEFIAADPVLSKYVKRLIVDDGWQYCYGEWDANSLFPSGMASLASKIRKLGFTPGLWIAPVAAEPHSRIAQWDTDMLAMSEGGDPCLSFQCMRRLGFVIDPTVEKSQRFWYDLFSRYADYGYGYFKIDFLMSLFTAPRFHDNTIPRGELVRKLITPIAAAAKGRAEILGCGYGYEAGTDMIHMVRAGSDIHATWNSAKRNAVAVAARSWASNRLWVTDPDFCVCRGPETSADPDIGRLRCLYVFTKPEEKSNMAEGVIPYSYGFDDILAGEARCLLSIALINGGAINLSDKLYVLNDTGLDLVRRTVSAERGFAGKPIDLFESDIASRWIQRTPSGFRVLLVNWEDVERELSLDFGAMGYNAGKARNFWTDEVIDVTGNVVKKILAPHSCLLLEFKK